MMRGIPLIILSLSVLQAAHASDRVRITRDDTYRHLSDEMTSMYTRADDLTLVSRQSDGETGTVSYRDVKVPEAGKLAECIGDGINDIDSLVVRGPINAGDFHTIWSGSFNGRLSVVNLENATLENGEVPPKAFWHQDQQLMEDGATIRVISLRKLMLPETTESIGELAFSYAIHLESVNIPKSLRELGLYTFSDCMALKGKLKFPDGISEIPGACFLNCASLEEVSLPPSVRYIGECAFYMAKVSRVRFSEGLATIGNAAFYGSGLEEVELPSTCLEFIGIHHFALNHKLRKINVPYGVREIPSGFLYNDLMLEECDLPPTIEIIGADAFWACESLPGINLYEGLREIKANGLWHCSSLKDLTLPSTVTYLGGASCMYLLSLEAIYCKAPVPPVCDEDPDNKGLNHTFGQIIKTVDYGTPDDIPVYIPKGSLDLYRNAYGWNYFKNFIETEFSGIEDVTPEAPSENDVLYDTNGQQVVQPVRNHIYIRNGKKVIFR